MIEEDQTLDIIDQMKKKQKTDNTDHFPSRFLNHIVQQ